MAIIKLFKACRIDRDKNFVVDNISTYLDTLEATTINDFQYVKSTGLNVSIKIDSNQANLEVVNFDDSINYVSIRNSSSESPRYYFIVSRKWISKECILLDLFMDVLNTYKPSVDFDFSQKTKITREHRQRFKDVVINERTAEEYQPATPITPTIQYFYLENGIGANITNIEVVFTSVDTCNVTSKTFDSIRGRIQVVLGYHRDINVSYYVTYKRHKTIRDIDLISEGISPILYHKPSQDLQLEESLNLDWYLIYKNRNDISPTNVTQVNPVDVYLAPSKQVKNKILSSSPIIRPSDLTTGRYYYITYGLNGAIKILGSTQELIANVSEKYFGGARRYEYIVIVSNGSKITLYEYNNYDNPNVYQVSKILANLSEITLKDKTKYTYYYDSFLTNSQNTIVNMSQSVNTFTGEVEVTIYDITSVDRTDSKLIKIIKLPYSLLDYEYNSSTNVIELLSTGWTYESVSHLFKLDDINSTFGRTLKLDINPLAELLTSVDSSNKFALKNPINESKLYHSDYYFNKFVYDSFGFIFQLEKVNPTEEVISGKFTIDYNVTSTINSRFLFTFVEYDLEYAESDYANILPISRNNEVTLYNSSYINYIRNGFNYDVKSKNRQIGASWLSTGLSAIGAIAGFASAGATGGASLIPAITLATSTIAGLTSAINTTLTAEQNIQAKLTQYQNQSVSVAGADDIDLLSVYSGNRAKMVTYEVSPRMKSLLFDLFYYCGYKADYMASPVTNSRYWFNFLQCELIMINKSQINDEIIEQITALYNTGVTFLHDHEGAEGESHYWDFSQELENWEV